jgi:hypothetical protein
MDSVKCIKKPVDRQAGILDTALMAGSTVAVIGVGRAITAVELVASCAVGEFLLIDPQTVDATNVGQSGYTHADVGQPKVRAASRRIHAINPAARIEAHTLRAENIDNLTKHLARADVVKIGIDDPRAQFTLADLSQAAGTPAIVAGNTGNGQQFFAAVVFPDGPPLKVLLPAAWKAVQSGFSPPAFYPSCRLFAERLNLLTVGLILSLLHEAKGSDLPIVQAAQQAREHPILIGFHGVAIVPGEDAALMFNPIRMLAAPPS